MSLDIYAAVCSGIIFAVAALLMIAAVVLLVSGARAYRSDR